MGLGPIEVVVIGFGQDRFDGSILPELQRLVDSGTIRIVDAVLARKDADGAATVLEIDDATDDGLDALRALVSEIDGLISDDDVDELVEELAPGSAAAILCFEHTWVVPLRDAISAAGGQLLDTMRIPGPVADDVLAAVAALDNQD
ncbi:DUF6325 family protein [Demequina capsici]|uniref:DUF6325 family protein n=1 Tax=Demequina capsici TaxID=3075620 RepID=A0AA96F5P0_9MICO|nr:DUF6325 family protein [Demequina sp. OYTSA14]WNM23809.1 DUF6325 family protein [Demequina sp. OYTSA14]